MSLSQFNSGTAADTEAARLEAVRRLDILDTPADGTFDRITALAAELFGCPIAIVSLVDHDRIWFKSHHGLEVQQIGRDLGLCASAIMQVEPWILTDAKTDVRALTNPLVAGEFGLRFYAGVPLRTADGYNLGTLCVIDRQPRKVTPKEITQLQHLAQIVMDQMELRLSARLTIAEKDAALAQAEMMAHQLDRKAAHHAALFDRMAEGFALCEAIWSDDGALTDYAIREINPALQSMLGVGPEVVGRSLSQGGADNTNWLRSCEGVLRTGVPVGIEYRNPNTHRWHEIRLNRVDDNNIAQFFFDITERKKAELQQADLFDELNHRVKNSLATVAGFLNLQARQAEPIVRDNLLKAAARVHSVSDVHGILYKGSRKESVEFAAYLQQLCSRLAESLLDGGRVTLDVNAQEAEVPVDTAIALGMIVNELVTNAAKYAYPAPQTGIIAVRFLRRNDGLLLSIDDLGQGLPKETEERSAGLGMKLVKSLVAQLHASVVVQGGQGTRFEIRIPKADS